MNKKQLKELARKFYQCPIPEDTLVDNCADGCSFASYDESVCSVDMFRALAMEFIDSIPEDAIE